MTDHQRQRFLFIRLDRIGDLVLTLPADSAVETATVDWWIPKGLSFVTANASPPRHAQEVESKIGIHRFLQLLREVRSTRYDGTVVFHAPWWVSLLVWLARVPVRGGVRSQWHSFLFFNRSIRQKRSQAEHSELEYAYQLVEQIFKIKKTKRQGLQLRSVTSTAHPALLNELGLIEFQYLVAHPGMSGSALNWPIEHYAQLIRSLAKSQTVVITGTASDAAYLQPLRALTLGEAHIQWLDGRLTGQELIAVLEKAKAVIAPSTGVVHLAASTGRPTLGLYSPVRVQSAQRWGPIGEHVQTLTPEVRCPGEKSCLGTACQLYSMNEPEGARTCMRFITPEQVVNTLNALRVSAGNSER